MSALITRFLLLCGALAVFANFAFGGGTYQRTKDGKTIVWNNDPEAADAANWWGDRDRDGYATGFGTLTWYKAQKQIGTGPKGRSVKYTVYARYFGNMVRGKFDGPVNAHSKGKTAYAIFTDGKRTSTWAAGPAPSRRVAELGVERAREKGADIAKTKNTERATPNAERRTEDIPAEGPPRLVSQTENPSSANAHSADTEAPNVLPGEQRRRPSPKYRVGAVQPTVTDTPAEGPPSGTGEAVAPKPDEANRQQTDTEPVSAKGSGGAESKALAAGSPPNQAVEQTGAKPSTTKTGKTEADNSLRRLTHPPSSLRTEQVPDASLLFLTGKGAPSRGAHPRLSKQEVIDLADAEARTHGYDPREYQRSEPQYDAADETWSLLYEQKVGDGMVDVGKHFSVAVDDKTKNISVVPER
jgi:hypothetical protein